MLLFCVSYVIEAHLLVTFKVTGLCHVLRGRKSYRLNHNMWHN